MLQLRREWKNIEAEYCEYVDGYKIDEKGCRHLSKAAWGKLEDVIFYHYSFTHREKISDRAAGTSGKVTAS